MSTAKAARFKAFELEKTGVFGRITGTGTAAFLKNGSKE
jgi:hypothetical protein